MNYREALVAAQLGIGLEYRRTEDKHGNWFDMPDEQVFYGCYEYRIKDGRESTKDVQRATENKSRPDLFPGSSLLRAGDVLGFGESKHPDQKWKSMSVDEHLGAVMRHYAKWQAGNHMDAESGLSHLAHALVRMAFAVALEKPCDKCTS